jgi:hypothetical protein
MSKGASHHIINVSKMTGTAWGEGGEGSEAEFEVSLTEARRTRRGEEGRENGASFFSSAISVSSVPP